MHSSDTPSRIPARIPGRIPARSPAPPLPPPGESWALFLDVDGTLTEFAPRPEEVVVDDLLLSSLQSLSELLDGAIAIVSGRPVAQIDALFAPLRLAAGGLHGLERRETAGGPVERTGVPAWRDAVHAEVDAFAAAHEGTWVEDKGITVALHYRAAPALEPDALALAARIAESGLADLDVLRGKMIVEFRPDSAHKGSAIETFMESPPFAGRTPVFIGDDVTDEDGFIAVKRRGGISIRVGDDAETAAEWRIPSVAESHRWIAEVAACLRRRTCAGAK